MADVDMANAAETAPPVVAIIAIPLPRSEVALNLNQLVKLI